MRAQRAHETGWEVTLHAPRAHGLGRCRERHDPHGTGLAAHMVVAWAHAMQQRASGVGDHTGRAGLAGGQVHAHRSRR